MDPLFTNRPMLVLSMVLFLLVSEITGQSTHTNCYAFGTEHILTFDNERIDFSSPCRFSLAYTCPASAEVTAHFRVNIQNVMVDEVSRVECVEVIYEDFVVVLCRDQTATVGGTAVDTLITPNDKLMVYTGTSGIEVAIHAAELATEENVIVTITPSGMVRVSVPNNYASSLCGLCGNFDGDATNHLQTDGGLNVSALDLYERGAKIAGSWLIPDANTIGCQDANDVMSFVHSDCLYVENVTMEISQDTTCGVYERGMLMFDSCITAHPQLAAMFESICKYDFCENYLTATDHDNITSSGCLEAGNCAYDPDLAKLSVNNVAEVFVDECRSRGIELDTWRTDYEAPLTCSGTNTEYTFSGEKCPAVCGLPDDRCTQVDREGCHCQTGTIRDGATGCLAEEACGCSDPQDGTYYQAGDEWLDTSCTVRFVCYEMGNITLNAVSCSMFASCIEVNDARECSCNTGFTGTGYECFPECAAGEQPTQNQAACEPCPVGYYQPLDGQSQCTQCPNNEVTLQLGSTSADDCQEIVMLPDADPLYSNGDCVFNVYDQSYRLTVPSTVLPDGLPFGLRTYTSLYTSTNGLISFGRQFVGRDPVGLDGLDNSQFTEAIAAPFWFRQDLRRVDPANIPESKLCMSAYNVIDSDMDRAEESSVMNSIIRIMLSSSPRLEGAQFNPTYAYVATWYKSFSFPAEWYDAETIVEKEYATYQAVIATDGIRTFLMYIYPSGSEFTQLRRLNSFRSIYMGYNAQDGTNMFSLYLSTTNEIIDLASETPEPSNTDAASRWVFDVGSNRAEPNPYAEACISWYAEQQQVFQVFVEIPCPCSKWQAYFDPRFFYQSDSDCAISKYPTSGFYQRCCYDGFTALITDPRTAGFPSLNNPVLAPAAYESEDKLPYENCCSKSDHCTQFRQIRPVPRCEFFFTPRIACGYGDPHIYTLDGSFYTYNPVGEFWMIKSEMFSMQSRMVQYVNPLTDQVIAATQFQAFAMQSNDSGILSDELHIELNTNRTDYVLYRNKISITAALNPDMDNVADPTSPIYILFNGGNIEKFNGSITVSFDTGHSIRFSMEFAVLSAQSFVPSSESGKTTGLLGNNNGDDTDDITHRNGTLLCGGTSACDDQLDIHQEFGESWRITEDESLFWYRDQWNTAQYTDKEFSPVYITGADINDTVAAACDDRLSCIYDTILTNSTEIGMYTVRVEGEVVTTAYLFNNSAPTVYGPAKIETSINQMVTAVYVYGDPDGNATLLITSQPPGADITFDNINNQMTMTWTPDNDLEVMLSMYAVEDSPDGLTSSELNVEFRISPDCQNGGSANFTALAPGGTVSPLFYRVICDCQFGWEGDSCDQDIDGCMDDPCYNTTCIDVPANETDSALNGTLYICPAANCTEGFVRTNNSDTDECFDRDECILDMPCPLDLCVNTLGSFICNCPSGYEKLDNGTCLDVDDCDRRLDDCTDICTNTEGGYECSCFQGGTLQDDNVTCQALIQDALCGGTYNCTYACADEILGECACPRNRALDPSDNQTCIALDECSDDALNGCDTESGAVCNDLVNGYECTCQTGYVLSANTYQCEKCRVGRYGDDCMLTCHCGDKAKTCDNILGCTDCNIGWEGDQCKNNTDECSDPDICPEFSECIDTEGSYTCRCDNGYRSVYNTSANRTECHNIDECTELSQPCSVNAECADLIGGYSCTCKAGFIGDGITCTNINECLNSPCVADAVRCVDEVPGFSCICRPGSQGDGRVDGSGCMDVNECKDAVNACPAKHSICVNDQFSYSCTCEQYYTGNGYSSCTDINECDVSGAVTLCGTITNGFYECINLEPLYECEARCDDGYLVVGNDTCENENECLTNLTAACPGDHVTCNDTDGSHTCTCDENYEFEGGICTDIDECTRDGTDALCTDPLDNGQWICVNQEPLYECTPDCDNGYINVFENGVNSCANIDECIINPSAQCPGDHVTCVDTEGSYECVCDDGFDKIDNLCEDIDECLTPGQCPGDYETCENIPGNYTCSCFVGYSEPNCERNDTITFLEATQTFDLPPESGWSDTNSPEFYDFLTNFKNTLADLYNTSEPGFIGFNIIGAGQSPDDPTHTEVEYEVVYNPKPTDIEHRTLFTLLTTDGQLDYNNQTITDLKNLTFDGIKWSCSNIVCRNNFTCKLDSPDNYPYCECSGLYSGYNCGNKAPEEAVETIGNLLPLWISVAVASSLLVVGMCACCGFLLVTYRRRRRRRHEPAVHRHPIRVVRGPAIFNPSSRVPAEAYNYQFPRGSIRSSASDDTVSSEGASTTRTGATSRLGSTTPFAPRWPRAYYSQLGDLDG